MYFRDLVHSNWGDKIQDEWFYWLRIPRIDLVFQGILEQYSEYKTVWCTKNISRKWSCLIKNILRIFSYRMSPTGQYLENFLIQYKIESRIFWRIFWLVVVLGAQYKAGMNSILTILTRYTVVKYSINLYRVVYSREALELFPRQ